MSTSIPQTANQGNASSVVWFCLAILRSTFRNRKGLLLTLGLPIFMLFTFWISTRADNPEEFDLMGIMFPAIVALGAMMSGMMQANRMTRWKELGIIDRLELTPIPVSWLVVGAGVVQVIVGVLQGCLILLFGLGLGGIHVDAGGAIISIAIMGLSALTFIAFGSMLAAILPRSDLAGYVFMGVFLPLFFLGSFPQDMLPETIRNFLPWLPTTMTIDLIGSLFYTGQFSETATFSIVGLFAYTAVLFLVGMGKHGEKA